MFKDKNSKKVMNELIKSSEYNSFQNTLEELVSKKSENETDEKVFLLFLKLTNIEEIKNKLGYEAEPKIIDEVVERLQEVNYHALTVIEGNKFLLLFNEITIEECERINNHIFSIFQQTFELNDYDVFITINIGCAFHPCNGEDPIFRKAELALNQAVIQGNNDYYIYEPSLKEIDIKSYRNFILQNDFFKAITNNQIKTFYQPHVLLENGKIISTQLYLRWFHEEWGTIYSEEVLKIAEQTGTANLILDFILDSIHKNLTFLIEQNIQPVPFHFEICPNHFRSLKFGDYFISKLQEKNIPPSLIYIELKFGNPKEDLKNNIILKNIEILKNDGVNFVSANYGETIYMHKQFNLFNYFKIKSDFISNLFEDDIYLTTLEFFNKLGREQNKHIIIEGIKTKEQRSVIKKVEGEMVQGDLYSPPIPFIEFTKTLIAGNLKGDFEKEEPENKREFFRVDLPKPIISSATILRIKGKYVSLKSTQGLIENIGPGGFAIMLNLDLPKTEEMILGFETRILGQNFSFEGVIKWKKTIKEGLFLYGIFIYMDEDSRHQIFKVLNRLSSNIRRSIPLENTEHLKGNKYDFFQN